MRLELITCHGTCGTDERQWQIFLSVYVWERGRRMAASDEVIECEVHSLSLSHTVVWKTPDKVFRHWRPQITCALCRKKVHCPTLYYYVAEIRLDRPGVDIGTGWRRIHEFHRRLRSHLSLSPKGGEEGRYFWKTSAIGCFSWNRIRSPPWPGLARTIRGKKAPLLFLGIESIPPEEKHSARHRRRFRQKKVSSFIHSSE